MRNLYFLFEWRPRTGGGTASEPPVLQHKLESGTSFKTVPCILVHQNIKENANNHLILRLQMYILFSNRIILASLIVTDDTLTNIYMPSLSNVIHAY